ncbi:unnamed protein product, partial [Prorocentrum cordatum]
MAVATAPLGTYHSAEAPCLARRAHSTMAAAAAPPATVCSLGRPAQADEQADEQEQQPSAGRRELRPPAQQGLLPAGPYYATYHGHSARHLEQALGALRRAHAAAPGGSGGAPRLASLGRVMPFFLSARTLE